MPEKRFVVLILFNPSRPEHRFPKVHTVKKGQDGAVVGVVAVPCPADFNKVVLPFALLRRLECALEPTRDKVCGWCKIRDGIVLPLLMQGGVYVIKLVLSKTVTQTATA